MSWGGMVWSYLRNERRRERRLDEAARKERAHKIRVKRDPLLFVTFDGEDFPATGPGWQEVAIPRRETHVIDPPRTPHRSRWRLTGHRGENCLWARIRIARPERTDIPPYIAQWEFPP